MKRFCSSLAAASLSHAAGAPGGRLGAGAAPVWPPAWRPPAPRRPYQVAGPAAAGGDLALLAEPEPNQGLTANAGAAEEDPEIRRMRLEAVLFLAKSPLSPRKLAGLADLADGTEARTLVRALNEVYDAAGRALRVEQVAGGYRLLTRPALAPWLARLAHLPPAIQLSSPMMETLAVVAYRQPASRADVEAVRGVACGELLRQLMQRDLVRIAGRGEELGRPYLYGTTKRFLQIFGLRSPDDLPAIDLQALQEDVSGSEANDTSEPAAPDSSTSPKESVVSTAAAPALPGADPETEAPAGAAAASSPAAPESSDAAAVIEDEEDDLYEGTDDFADEEELEDEELDDDEIDDDELDDDELDEDDWDDDDDDDDEEDLDDDEVDSEWKEVDDADEDEDDEDDEEDWDDEDDWDEDDIEEDDVDEDEDWD